MIWKLFSQHRGTIWGVVALLALIIIHEVTALSKWVLLLPVLLAMFVLMKIWDRVLARQNNTPEL